MTPPERKREVACWCVRWREVTGGPIERESAPQHKEMASQLLGIYMLKCFTHIVEDVERHSPERFELRLSIVCQHNNHVEDIRTDADLLSFPLG